VGTVAACAREPRRRDTNPLRSERSTVIPLNDRHRPAMGLIKVQNVSIGSGDGERQEGFAARALRG